MARFLSKLLICSFFCKKLKKTDERHPSPVLKQKKARNLITKLKDNTPKTFNGTCLSLFFNFLTKNHLVERSNYGCIIMHYSALKNLILGSSLQSYGKTKERVLSVLDFRAFAIPPFQGFALCAIALPFRHSLSLRKKHEFPPLVFRFQVYFPIKSLKIVCKLKTLLQMKYILFVW